MLVVGRALGDEPRVRSNNDRAIPRAEIGSAMEDARLDSHGGMVRDQRDLLVIAATYGAAADASSTARTPRLGTPRHASPNIQLLNSNSHVTMILPLR
jgi:hypothetical protein